MKLTINNESCKVLKLLADIPAYFFYQTGINQVLICHWALSLVSTHGSRFYIFDSIRLKLELHIYISIPRATCLSLLNCYYNKQLKIEENEIRLFLYYLTGFYLLDHQLNIIEYLINSNLDS